jgi:hypothetical protein
MVDIQDLTARESDASIAARHRLAQCISKNEEEQNRILQRVVSHVIVDRLVHPLSMEFVWPSTWSEIGVQIDAGGAVGVGEPQGIHRHALGQMADTSGLTRTYLNRLRESGKEWMHDLLVYNLGELFGRGDFVDRKGNPKRFLVRTANNQIRGFLSQNYNRKLTTAPLLRAFIEKCRELGAGPIETTATDVRVRVKYALPYVFEPVGGEFVAFGVAFGNSDYGAGRLSVSGSIQRISSGTTTVLSDKYSRTHLGSVIQDSDIEMSPETADKELDAVKSAIRDAVVALLGKKAIESNLRAIQVAHQKEIPWYRLKTKLGTVLGKDDIDMLDHIVHGGAAVIDLPRIDLASSDDGDSPTAWWAANAVGMFADKENDPDRKSALQNMAGQLMTG